jgi:signal transduction histidine kinase
VEVQDAAGDWWLLRIRPYRTSEGKTDGAIVAAVDIDVLKRSVLAAEEATRAANTLSEASVLLASSLDYETTLASLANLCTGEFADWCAFDLVDDDGTIRHLAVAHVNPVLRDLALQFQKTTFAERETAPGAPQALRLREPVLLNELAGSGDDTKIGQLVSALGVRSLMSVPMIVRDRVLGTATFSSSKRQYQPADLKLAESLSQRAAIALDMAMLFREAESANRFKDAFLGTVAHELRTPLTSIIGWVQLAQRNRGMVGECLTHVDASASLMRVFVEDLLDVARIREQKLKLNMADIDFVDVVRSAMEMTVLAASGREIQVRFDREDDPVPLRGDSIRLMQVVWNLLSNAIKFTQPRGKIDVHLDRIGSDARLVVIDSGVGISPEFAPHAFELYRQADDSGTHTPGLGIGLSIVAEIVKMHGGTARVDSPGLGGGSKFTITLPMTAPPDPPPPERRSVNTRRAGDRRILISKTEEPS